MLPQPDDWVAFMAMMEAEEWPASPDRAAFLAGRPVPGRFPGAQAVTVSQHQAIDGAGRQPPGRAGTRHPSRPSALEQEPGATDHGDERDHEHIPPGSARSAAPTMP